MKFEIPGQGRVIGFYGRDMQSLVQCEELAELIQAISKIRRYQEGGDVPPDAYDNLVEEVADTLIILEQILEMYDIPNHEIQGTIDYKCARQEERMDESLGRNP